MNEDMVFIHDDDPGSEYNHCNHWEFSALRLVSVLGCGRGRWEYVFSILDMNEGMLLIHVDDPGSEYNHLELLLWD